MLKEFRTERLIWDRANTRIRSEITANGGDSNGRELEVQILNGGLIEDTSGISVSLSWKTKEGQPNGLDSFEEVNSAQGIYKITYTTGMLSNPGELSASLVLVTDTDRIESDTFKITVNKSNVDEGAVQSDNSFTALTTALATVNEYDNKINTLKTQTDTKITKFKDETNAQLAETASKTHVENLMKDITSGTPKIVVQTVSDLPVIGGSEKLALVLENGHKYFDNGTQWVDAGVYQATDVSADMVSLDSGTFASKDTKSALEESKEKFSGRVLKLVNSLHNMEKFSISSTLDIPKNVVDNSIVEFEVKNNGITTNEMIFNGFRSKSANLFNKATVVRGKYADHTTGEILNEPSQLLFETSDVIPGTDYSFGSDQGVRYARMVYYNSAGDFLSGDVGGILDGYVTLKAPDNASKLIVSFSNQIGNVDIFQLEKGIGIGEYKNFIDETVLLDNPVRLIGHNNVSDTLNHEGVLVKKFGKSILSGHETWYYQEATTSHYRFFVSSSDVAPNIIRQTANIGIGKSTDGDFSIMEAYIDSKGIAIRENGNLFLTVPKAKVDGYEGATPLEKFKKYLAAFPVTLYYQLTTAQTELVKMNYPLAYSGGQFQLLTSVPSATELKLSVQKPVDSVVSKTLIKLEEAGKAHFGGYAYTAFGGGVMVDGKEVFILRNAKRHVTNTGDYGRTVAYIRDKSGQWENKIIDLGFNDKEFRDVNLSLPYDGTRDIILSGALFDGNTYENWVFRLDKDLNLISSEQMVTDHDYFSWGNYLFSPSGVGMKTAYDINYSETSRGVRLLRESGDIYDDSVVLFEGSSSLPTEATIGYWGNKLVAVTRQNAGLSLYRETTDLEGLTGWSEPKLLDFKAHAPCLQPYTPEGEPLILTFSSVSPMITETRDRHRDVSITATYNGINWHKEVVIAENNHYGGYNSFVKIGAGKYGMTYYDDYDKTKPNYKDGTDLYYEQVDVDRYLNDLEWFKYQNRLTI